MSFELTLGVMATGSERSSFGARKHREPGRLSVK
jgi:hypothetical protein